MSQCLRVTFFCYFVRYRYRLTVRYRRVLSRLSRLSLSGSGDTYRKLLYRIVPFIAVKFLWNYRFCLLCFNVGLSNLCRVVLARLQLSNRHASWRDSNHRGKYLPYDLSMLYRYRLFLFITRIICFFDQLMEFRVVPLSRPLVACCLIEFWLMLRVKVQYWLIKLVAVIMA